MSSVLSNRGVVAGSSMQALGNTLAELLSIPMATVDLSRFANRELRVRVHDGFETTYLMQSFGQPVNSSIIEYLLMADALRRMGVAQLVSIIPWFGYSKQDKVFVPGEPLSVEVVAGLIQSTQTKQLITVDLHKSSIADYFDIPVVNISPEPLFVDGLKGSITGEAVVVSPDAGSVRRSELFAKALSIPVVQISKQRDLISGEVSILGMNGSVEGKQVIIYDDMIATGSTMIVVSQYLKEHGAQSIVICATHHLYIDGVQQKLDQAGIDAVYVTDTISKPDTVISSKLKVLSIAPSLVETLNS